MNLWGMVGIGTMSGQKRESNLSSWFWVDVVTGYGIATRQCAMVFRV